ncbi:MAG: hypothetical protein ACRDH2_12935 [Anaerolineales bacterium]
MIGQELRQLQEALNRKADSVQREFTAVGDQLKVIGRRLLERNVDREPLLAEQEALRARQQALAGEVNLWRDRARGVVQQRSDELLRAFLRDILAALPGDEAVRPAVEHVLYLLDAPEEELAKLAQRQAQARPTTPAGRLLERARTEFDLRGSDPAPRQRAAFEFANRPGMAQDEAAIVEIEAALEAPDPTVREVALLTAIQLHRFRALRLADLDAAHASVERLARLDHPSVIPVLIAVLETPRTGFTQGVEGNNRPARLVALRRLAEWHTAEAQNALRARQSDRDPAIATEAAQALDASPGEWTGPTTSL